MSKTYRRYRDTHCDICGEKLSKAERKGTVKRCADCQDHYDIEEYNFLLHRCQELTDALLIARAKTARVIEMDGDDAAKLRKKLAKVEAERDALKAELADMERDRNIWRADANVLRDRWMAAVKVNNALASVLRGGDDKAPADA